MADETNERGSGPLLTAVVLIAIYFFFPVILAAPVIGGINHGWIPKAAAPGFELVFSPIDYLHGKVPAYRALLDAEKKLFSSLGLWEDLER